MSTEVQIHKHQPERRRQAVTTLHCGCSCCCCCCLHTLGSIVGAAVAPTLGRGAPMAMAMTYYYDDETGEALPDVRKPGFGAVTIFWWLLSFLIFLGLLGTILTNPTETGSLVVTGVVILLLFPALQLVSVFLTLIVFAVWPRADKSYQLKQLSKIAVGVVVGSVLGVVVMVVIGALFGVLR